MVSFPTVWKNLESLIYEGLLVSVHEVFKEIKKSNTFLHLWCQNSNLVFQKRDYDILNIVRQIMTKHPKLVNVDRTKDSAVLLANSRDLHVLQNPDKI